MTTSHHFFSGGSHHQLSFPWLWYPSCSASIHSCPLEVYSKHSSRLNPFKMIKCQIISLLCSESFSGSLCPQRKSQSQWFLLLSKKSILYQSPQGSAWTGSSFLFLWLHFLLPLATWLHSHFFLLFCEHTGHTLRVCLEHCLSYLIQFSSSVMSNYAIPWTAARQASLSINNSWSLLKLMSVESVMPSNYLILCRPLLLPPSIFPSIRVFSNESVLRIRWPKYASVLQVNIQDLFPLGWTDWISLLSKVLSRVFSHTTVQKHQFFGAQSSLRSISHIHTWLLEKP